MKFFRRHHDAVVLATRTPPEKVALHLDRYARAIAQAEVDVANGEKTPERLAELKKEQRYWQLVDEAMRLQGGE